jgi:hypothetical protein
MWRRVSWAAILAVGLLLVAMAAALNEENTFAVVCALGSVTAAILSLKD